MCVNLEISRYAGSCECRCECSYLLILALIIWIGVSFSLHGPRFYIQELYVPGLDLSLIESTPPTNISSNTTQRIVNPSLFFDLALVNMMNDHSVSYGDVNISFSYGQSSVANYIVPTFYQAKGKNAHRREVLEARGMPWEDARRAVSNGSKTVFRVDLEARPRFKFLFWYSKKKNVRVGANVEVDGLGTKVQKDDIRLNTAASKHKAGFLVVLLSTFVHYIIIFL